MDQDEKPNCTSCGSAEHVELWGESGEYWWHCHECGVDFDLDQSSNGNGQQQ